MVAKKKQTKHGKQGKRKQEAKEILVIDGVQGMLVRLLCVDSNSHTQILVYLLKSETWVQNGWAWLRSGIYHVVHV
jgi:hypothetical protein